MSNAHFILKRIGPKFMPLAAILGLLFTTLQPVRAQTLTTLYSFTGGADGGNPYFGDLVLDAKGNLYGTTFAGGANPGLGVVFEVTPAGAEKVLHTFNSADGCSRNAPPRCLVLCCALPMRSHSNLLFIVGITSF
jgi:uncharacterized repeat protein (TIGR03803 family)